MAERRLGSRTLLLGALVALAVPLAPDGAAARMTHYGTYNATNGQVAAGHFRALMSGMRHSRIQRAQWTTGSRNGISCVPFARLNSGIEIVGNAATWWNHADGVYARGNQPEIGSVLNFRATGRMRLGHVAVVSNVINARELEIDHANWAVPGAVTLATKVVDVSPANDWTQVRVAIDHRPEFGSVYPTYGFIYDRPDTGTLLANAAPDSSMPSVPLASGASSASPEEVAELPAEPQHHAWPHRHSRLRAGSRLHHPSALANRKGYGS